MQLKDLASFLDTAVPVSFQEGYDNSGLQVGDPMKTISSGLLSLDVTEQVLDEAIGSACDVIISHHPVIFNPLKQISGKNSVERVIMKAIRNDVAVYSAHTNLDIVENGVSRKLAGKIGLKNVKVLTPLKHRLLKLVTFIPADHLDRVRDAVFAAGAGFIGAYDRCGFTVEGSGSFRAGEGSRPFAGEKGRTHFEKEIRFETILFSYMKRGVVKALLESHPYEEVAFDLYPLENENLNAGLGCVGNLPEPVDEKSFLTMLKENLGSGSIRYSNLTGKKISKVALCGGSGGQLTGDAIASGADAFVTADLKYHSFFEAENRILLVDAGHYETEKFSTELLYDLITKKFPKFALRFSEINTNPINYF
ncbi:MAG TPA: Nif3-like dinuclear metal center hexameric protein [Bacteroidales bacterium]|nr:Nif3-like dinuclear metal center hexameric protein [Bacteroidales bacterium]HPJ59162.1 Nif3-like dinuclear metal center hexameric protein [Bacteroidales bacterium]HPR12774.1 Nif3-like dinuclear metal center hexameric protein [Bacteroidales bacterium]HRW84378.1 Nif3-like dinuclear metal center hexameric protein [Bacteroidales bacterium]